MKTVPQGGAIVFRTDEGSVRILLVRAKQDPSQWIFPKGHLEPGESHGAAALREAHEEAGITGIVVALVGPSTFQSGDEKVTVEYYLVQTVGETASAEGRDKRWVTPAEALDELAFEDARELLRTALPELERRARGSETERFKDLMLHEYDHVGQSLLANEEGGEKRVTFFITLCGAVGAGLGFVLGRTEFGLPERLLVGLTSVVLLVLGYATFLRVIVRNAASDRYKTQLARIRQYFLSSEADRRLNFMPFHPFTKNLRETGKSAWRFGKGGWAETVALVESLLAGGLVAFASWTAIEQKGARAAMLSVALGVEAALIVWHALFGRADAVYKDEMDNDEDGSVPLRGKGGSLRVPR
jgi:8-oxo-dGTP pyrophosphatase MutT (NUDIX family)